MWTNPVFILGVLALILALVSYADKPTLGAAVICAAVAIIVSATTTHPHP